MTNFGNGASPRCGDAGAGHEPMRRDREDGLRPGRLLAETGPAFGVRARQYRVHRVAVADEVRRYNESVGKEKVATALLLCHVPSDRSSCSAVPADVPSVPAPRPG